MRLIHSECGGELEVDRSHPVTIMDKEIYNGVRCKVCKERLGVLANVDMAWKFVTDVGGHELAAN